MHFLDDSFYVAFVPESLSATALYGRSTQFGISDNFIKFQQGSVLANSASKAIKTATDSDDSVVQLLVVVNVSATEQNLMEYSIATFPQNSTS